MSTRPVLEGSLSELLAAGERDGHDNEGGEVVIQIVCARCQKEDLLFVHAKRHVVSLQPYRSIMVCADEDACLQRIANRACRVNLEQLALFPTFAYVTTGGLLGG